MKDDNNLDKLGDDMDEEDDDFKEHITYLEETFGELTGVMDVLLSEEHFEKLLNTIEQNRTNEYGRRLALLALADGREVLEPGPLKKLQEIVKEMLDVV